MVFLRRPSIRRSVVLGLCAVTAVASLMLTDPAVASGSAASVPVHAPAAIPAQVTPAKPSVAQVSVAKPVAKKSTAKKASAKKVAKKTTKPARKTATSTKKSVKKKATAKKTTTKKRSTAKTSSKKVTVTKAAAKRAAAPTSSQVKAARKAAGGGGVAALSTLHGLPGSAGVRIAWNEPALGSHLGGVWIGSTTTILLNARRLKSNPSLARDVVRHEIAHIYQGRLMRTYHLTWAQLGRKLAPAFGANSQEKSADCVARHLGARWTGYTSACSGAAKRAWVKAMLGGYLPKS